MQWRNLVKKLKLKKEKKVYDMEDLDIDEREDYLDQIKVKHDLKTNIKYIQNMLGNSFDLSIRKIQLGKEEIQAAVVFMAGLSDTSAVEKIIKSLQMDLLKVSISEKKGLVKKDNIFEDITRSSLNNKDIVITLLSEPSSKN